MFFRRKNLDGNNGKKHETCERKLEAVQHFKFPGYAWNFPLVDWINWFWFTSMLDIRNRQKEKGINEYFLVWSSKLTSKKEIQWNLRIADTLGARSFVHYWEVSRRFHWIPWCICQNETLYFCSNRSYLPQKIIPTYWKITKGTEICQHLTDLVLRKPGRTYIVMRTNTNLPGRCFTQLIRRDTCCTSFVCSLAHIDLIQVLRPTFTFPSSRHNSDLCTYRELCVYWVLFIY